VLPLLAAKHNDAKRGLKPIEQLTIYEIDAVDRTDPKVADEDHQPEELEDSVPVVGHLILHNSEIKFEKIVAVYDFVPFVRARYLVFEVELADVFVHVVDDDQGEHVDKNAFGVEGNEKVILRDLNYRTRHTKLEVQHKCYEQREWRHSAGPNVH